MKCFTHAALCILKGDASLRILSTDASGCFFTNVTFTAVAENGIRGEFCEKLSCIHWVQLVFRSSYLILNWRAYTFLLHIHVKYDYRIPFVIWKLQMTFLNVSSMKVFEFRLPISLKFIPKGPIDCKSALVQVMDWRRISEKPSPESMLTQFPDAYIRH